MENCILEWGASIIKKKGNSNTNPHKNIPSQSKETKQESSAKSSTGSRPYSSVKKLSQDSSGNWIVVDSEGNTIRKKEKPEPTEEELKWQKEKERIYKHFNEHLKREVQKAYEEGYRDGCSTGYKRGYSAGSFFHI